MPMGETMTTSPWADIARRAEEATGPDRELDHAVMVAVSGRPPPGVIWSTDREYTPFYTGSVDAIMTLIAEKLPGWRIAELKDGIRSENGEYCHLSLWCPVNPYLGYKYRVNATTAALALVAAFARARAYQDQDSDCISSPVTET